MKISIFDIEANGLMDATKIHILSVYYKDNNGMWQIKSTRDYDEMRKYFLKPQVLVGHYVKLYDIPVVERILGIKIPKETKVVDTCGLSWALYPEMNAHGLEEWGVHFGVPKVKVAEETWKGLSDEDLNFIVRWEKGQYTLNVELGRAYYEEISAYKIWHEELMKERCEQDIRINLELWDKIMAYLKLIYQDTPEVIGKYINYLMFKMDCLRHQEELKLDIDMPKVLENMNYFLPQKDEKEEELKQYMPKVPVKTKRTKPKKLYTKNGDLTKLAEKWFDLLELGNYPQDYDETVEIISGYEEPNPNSPVQVKEWLLSLGWKPIIYKQSTLASGEVSNNPQVRDADRNLCKSVLALIKEHPSVEVLDGLTVITHRLGVLKSFVNAANEQNKVIAGASGFTNTLRLKHVKPIANLPKVLKERSIRDGRYIRECIIAPKGYKFCGSDMSSLEDRMKQHYIYPYDPTYVQDMMTPDFDPHLDLAVSAGALTAEQADAHKKKEADYGEERHNYKTANYSCIYGVGALTLSKTLNISVSKAKKIIEAYWERNWSVKKLASDQFVKTVEGQMWQLNPVNGFYYSLRYDKDRFSTLNQGGGTYIFDTWVYNLIKQGVIPVMQYHDEMLSVVLDDEKEIERTTAVVKGAVQKVNRQLSLLREMDVDVQYGYSYAEVH